MHNSAWHVPLEAASASNPIAAEPTQECPSPSHAEMSSSSAEASSGIIVDAYDTDSQNSSPEENRRKRKHSSSGRFRNHKNSAAKHSQPMTQDDIEKKRKMNREYARKSRQKKSDEITQLKERCKEQEVIIEIYKKAISLLYGRVHGTAPTWAIRQLAWFPSQGSRHKTPNNVECFLPECDEKFFVELGNNAYGQLYQPKTEVIVQSDVKPKVTTEDDRHDSRHVVCVDEEEPRESHKAAATSAAVQQQPRHSYPAVTSHPATSVKKPTQILPPKAEVSHTPSPSGSGHHHVTGSHHSQLPYISSESAQSYPVLTEASLPLGVQRAIKAARQNPGNGGLVVYIANPESTQAPISENSQKSVETVHPSRMVDHPHAVNLVKREISSNSREYESPLTHNVPIVSRLGYSHLDEATLAAATAREGMTGLKWQVVEPGGGIQLVPTIKRSLSQREQMVSYVKTIVTETGEVQDVYRPVYETTTLHETPNIPSIVYEDDQASSSQSESQNAVVDNHMTAPRQTVILSPQASSYKGMTISAPTASHQVDTSSASHHSESRSTFFTGQKSGVLTPEQLQGIFSRTSWMKLASRKQLPATVDQESAETYAATSESFPTSTAGLPATQSSPLVQVSANTTQVLTNFPPQVRQIQSQVTTSAETVPETAQVYSFKKLEVSHPEELQTLNQAVTCVASNQPERLQTLNQVVTSVAPQTPEAKAQQQFFSSTMTVPTTTAASEDTSADYLKILQANTNQTGLSSLRSFDIDYSEEMELENLKPTIQNS